MPEPGDGHDRSGLPRSRRLTTGPEIRVLFERGKRSRTAHLDVFDSASPDVRSRIAIVVPRHGRPVVERNTLKRRLREILRTELLPRSRRLPVPPPDLLIRARREAYDATYGELKEQLVSWWHSRWARGSC